MKYFHLALILLLASVSSKAQAVQANDIVGVWLNQEKDAKIEIYQAQNKYWGKLVWVQKTEPDGSPKKDGLNPDPKLRSRQLLNSIILTGFVYKDGMWGDGKIYDPKSGKTYSAQAKLKGDKLELRGYVGVSLFGRTTTWTRSSM